NLRLACPVGVGPAALRALPVIEKKNQRHTHTGHGLDSALLLTEPAERQIKRQKDKIVIVFFWSLYFIVIDFFGHCILW
ncbi:MAG: hypothetical protein KBS54_05850, partial [Synergistaceae bacterium]|nr:hypothetical protein [Candidatus Equadaptatus faecalis]